MADSNTAYHQGNPEPGHGHKKGHNSHGFMGPVAGDIKVESAPGKLGEAGYVRIAKGK